MFDHEHGVAAGFELFQRCQQLLVIARVEPDGRFVENVKHAAQVRAQLRRQPNALPLAAGQRGDAAPKLQIAQADFAQELQPLPNLRQDIARDGSSAAREPELAEKAAGSFDRHLGERINRRRRLPICCWRLAIGNPQPYRPRQRLQPCSPAIRTNLPLPFLPTVPGLLDVFCARAAVHVGQIEQLAEPAAARAPALRRVIAEMLRIKRLEGATALRASPFRGMDGSVLVVIQGEQRPLPQLKRFVNNLLRLQEGGRASVPASPISRRCLGSRGRSPSQPSPLLPGIQHPHDDLHVMLAKPIQAQALGGGIELPIRPDLGIAMAGGPFGHIRVEALAIPHHGRQQQQVTALAQFVPQPPPQFIARLRFDRHLAIRTELRPQPREEQPDEMIDLRDGGHGALAPAAAGALLDAHRRGDAGDQVHVRPGQLLHELPGIDVHGIQEPPLPFRKQQVKRQRALARPAHPGHDDKPPPRHRERHILQIVLPRPVNRDGPIPPRAQFSIIKHRYSLAHKRGPRKRF